MQAAIEKELSRLEALTELQLLDVLVAMENDPAPNWVHELILKKVNSILNQRIGLPN